MYAKLDKENNIVDFYSYNQWIEGMTLEDTALFVAEVTKLLSEVKR
ncbi:MAG: hypothetical protein AABY22_06025 [Nanoarchaeota archaeon]